MGRVSNFRLSVERELDMLYEANNSPGYRAPLPLRPARHIMGNVYLRIPTSVSTGLQIFTQDSRPLTIQLLSSSFPISSKILERKRKINYVFNFICQSYRSLSFIIPPLKILKFRSALISKHIRKKMSLRLFSLIFFLRLYVTSDFQVIADTQ